MRVGVPHTVGAMLTFTVVVNPTVGTSVYAVGRGVGGRKPPPPGARWDEANRRYTVWLPVELIELLAAKSARTGRARPA